MTPLKINGRKKLLLVVSMIALPFVGLLLWAVTSWRHNGQTPGLPAGLNMQLPAARIKNDSAENKLSIYQQAEKDSLRFRQAQQDDPYYKADTQRVYNDRINSVYAYDSGTIPARISIAGGSNYALGSLNTPGATLQGNERQITQKLAMLNNQVNRSAARVDSGITPNSIDNEQAQQVQAKIQQLGSAGTEDPQMAQMSNMLDKIQEIQNPGLLQQKLKAQSLKNRGQVLAVSTGRKDSTVSTLDASFDAPFSAEQANGFYSLDGLPANNQQNAIEAVVHNAQTVVNGSTVKLRLVNDVFINGVLIPKENFVFGVAALNGDRLEIRIASIRYGRSIFPVDLSVYDIDGANGIYIPGAIARDVAKESADQSMQNLGLMSYNPSLSAQAASAGISAAKTLFSRKVRRVKVTVKAGYQVLLVDEKQKQNN